MKILTAAQIREADAYTIANEPIDSSDLMERAAGALTNWYVKQFATNRPVVVFCTTGNNGGDGLCLARLLYHRGYKVSVVVIVNHESRPTKDFQLNELRLKRLPIPISYPTELGEFTTLPSKSVVIDALFGSGLNRPISGLAADAVVLINNSSCTVVAIDIPSGLFVGKVTPPNSPIVCAHHTISFELPKLAFMFPDNYQYVGTWRAVSIGLDSQFLNTLETNNHYLTEQEAKALLKSPTKFTHKGNRGHALLIAGMFGKMGACVLASKAVLRAGAGLLSVFTPMKGCDIVQTAFPEAMVLPYNNTETIDRFPTKEQLTTENHQPKYQAIAIGPGIGAEKTRAKALKTWLQTVTQPLVMDADALNMVGMEKLLEFVPQNSILTPHPKEFERLAGKSANGFDRLEILRTLAVQYHIYIVLKGAHTAIACPDGNCYFNSTGNPAMATAGSGDVLTGIIAGLMAQGYPSKESALLGVYLHGLAGDRAAANQNNSITASDIVRYFGFSW